MSEELRIVQNTGNFTITEDGKRVRFSTTASNAHMNIPATNKKFTIEFDILAISGDNIGIRNENKTISYPGYSSNSTGTNLHNGFNYYGGSSTTTNWKPSVGDVGAISIDLENDKLIYYINGEEKYWRNIPFSYNEIWFDLGTGSATGGEVRFRFDPSEFNFQYPIMDGYINFREINYFVILNGKYLFIDDNSNVHLSDTKESLSLPISFYEEVFYEDEAMTLKDFIKNNGVGLFDLKLCTDDSEIINPQVQTTHELNLLQDDLLQADKIQLLNWFENEESVELGVNGVLNSKFTSIIEAKSSEQVGKIVATDNNQGTKYLVSTDKENWQRWNGTQWETVSWQNKDEINTLGMSKNTLKDITETQWQVLGETFYLGLYLHNHNAIIEKIDFQELVPDKTPEISSASLYILNTQAEIDITMTGNKLLGKITDGDKGKVQYRIVLNDEALYPEDGAFTPLLPEPQHINMRIPSNKINIGEQNTIRIEFQDAWGSIDTWARTFIGELNGLLFFDEMDELYSDEQGKVLKYLDFGDIVTGQISQSSKIRLQNTLGHEVTNVTVTVDWGKDENDKPKTAPAGTFLEFSHSDSPFVPLEKIDLGEKILDHEESYEFYVRLRTTLGITPSVSGQLKLCVRAEDTKEAFKN